MKVKGVGDTIRLSPSSDELSRRGIFNYLNESNIFVLWVLPPTRLLGKALNEASLEAKGAISPHTDVNGKLSICIRPW